MYAPQCMMFDENSIILFPCLSVCLFLTRCALYLNTTLLIDLLIYWFIDLLIYWFIDLFMHRIKFCFGFFDFWKNFNACKFKSVKAYLEELTRLTKYLFVNDQHNGVNMWVKTHLVGSKFCKHLAILCLIF